MPPHHYSQPHRRGLQIRQADHGGPSRCDHGWKWHYARDRLHGLCALLPSLGKSYHQFSSAKKAQQLGKINLKCKCNVICIPCYRITKVIRRGFFCLMCFCLNWLQPFASFELKHVRMKNGDGYQLPRILQEEEGIDGDDLPEFMPRVSTLLLSLIN